jgi:GNAT superfamily N-acetyltransferase
MTMAAEVRIRKIEPGEEAAAGRFFASRYALELREEAFRKRGERWKWQYWSHPEGKPGILVAELGSKIVGMIGTNAVRIRTPGGVIPAIWAGDLLIDPAVRGAGIGKKLVDAWKSGGAVAVGKGYGPIAYSLYVNRGFKGIWGFTQLHIVLSRTRLAARLLRRSERRNLLRLARVFARPSGRLRSGREPAVSDTLPAGAAALWRSAAAAYRFAFERDEKYLAWRFGAHPFHTYYFIEARGSAGLSGLAIVRITGDRIPIGVIADLIADPRDEDTVLALARDALSFLESRGAAAALIELPPALAPIVSAAFPCSFGEDFSIVLHTADPELAAQGVFDAASWYLSRSDSDADY